MAARKHRRVLGCRPVYVCVSSLCRCKPLVHLSHIGECHTAGNCVSLSVRVSDWVRVTQPATDCLLETVCYTTEAHVSHVCDWMPHVGRQETLLLHHWARVCLRPCVTPLRPCVHTSGSNLSHTGRHLIHRVAHTPAPHSHTRLDLDVLLMVRNNSKK